MTAEEKQLLLKDLSARLPYGVMAKPNKGVGFIPARVTTITDYIDVKVTLEGSLVLPLDMVQPYLRPMSSMTEEEKDELYTAMDWYGEIDETGNVYTKGQEKVYRETFYEYTDWLISHHFDFHGLIPMNLALEAPKGMYKTE